MKNPRVARRYAAALMMESEQLGVLDPVAKDMELLAALLRESKELRRLVASPIVSPAKKISVFRELLSSRATRQTLTFVNLLIRKNREALLPDILEQFHALLDEKRGIVGVEVKSAVEFTPEQERALTTQLEQRTNKTVRMSFSLDKAIKGGLVVKIGDTVLDASIQHQLQQLRDRFVEGGGLH